MDFDKTDEKLRENYALEDNLFGNVSYDQMSFAMTAGLFRKRDIPPEDYLFVNDNGGGIFSTVDFCQIIGGTGAGKTLFSMSLAVAVAAGRDFLGWRCTKPRKVIYFDGELAEVTIQERIELAVGQLTEVEQARVNINLLVFNRDSMLSDLGIMLEDLATPMGRMQIKYLIENSGSEMAVFDSRFCLLGADMKETGSMPTPLVLMLRGMKVFDLWLHHLGKDATKGGYGDKTAEFLMDTNIELETNIGDHRLGMKFHKKRKVKPASESLYADIMVEHQAGEWFRGGEVPLTKRHTKTRDNEDLVIKAMVELNIVKQSSSGDFGQHYIQRSAVLEYLMNNGYFERTKTNTMDRADRLAVNKAVRNLLDDKLTGDKEQLKLITK